MNEEEKPTDIRDVQLSSFSHAIGQAHVIEALRIAVESSFAQQQRLDDILLCGPPGLGKSSFATLLAHELGGVGLKEAYCTSLPTLADLNAVLLSAGEGLLLLDEIATLPQSPHQHALLEVLDKRRITVGGGKTSIPVSQFTLVACTTDPDCLLPPLLDRFRIILHLDYYTEQELSQIVKQRCVALGWSYEPELLTQIAQRGRQTPRIACRLLQSARRVSTAEGADKITVDHLRRACQVERISDCGLDNTQQKYLHLLANGPVRLNVLASVLGVSTKVLTKTVEPYLLRSSMIFKTDSGLRTLGDAGREHLKGITSS